MLRAGIPATIYPAVQTTQEMVFHNLLPALPEKLDLVSSLVTLVLNCYQIYLACTRERLAGSYDKKCLSSHLQINGIHRCFAVH